MSELGKVNKTQMGATMPYWAKIEKEEAGKLPTYGTPREFSEFVKLTENQQKAETTFYSNNALSENISKMKYCQLTYENKGVANEVLKEVYGKEVSEDDEVTYGAEDAAPFGGFAFYRTLIDKGVLYYEGVFYPKVKVTEGNATYDTMGENVTLAGETTNMLAYQCQDEKKTWKKTKLFATDTEALAWVKACFAASEAV